MPTDHVPRRVDRRLLLREVGLLTVGAAVLGVTTACAGEPSDSTPAGDPGGRTSPDTATGTSGDATGGAPPGDWQRVELGFVSAYVLARSGQAAVVDTGVEGSADDIEAVLGTAGLGWDAVGHVLLTHRHPDHVGSLPAVLERAPEASAYAGGADIPHITAPREPAAVGDGDTVFGLEIIETPGHTAGHISLLDPAGDGVLLAGDALNGSDGGVTGANPEFSEDMTTADASVRKLAGLEFGTALFGHGEPVEGGADDRVAELAASL